VKKFLASPRMRRRLGWVGSMLLVAAGIGVLILLLPGRSQVAAEPRGGPAYIPPEPDVPMRRTRGQLTQPLDVAAKFIFTAVIRKNVGESWDVVAPTFPGKSEYTKAEWAKGDDLPIIPFPVARARWRLDYSYRNEVGLAVALFPPQGSEQRAAVFNIDMRAFGTGKNRKWMVENFGPAGVEGMAAGGGSSNRMQASGLPDLNPVGTSGSSRLSNTWLIVPLGILGLALLFPLGLGISSLIRARRAEREFAQGAR
jgi:hypothetical protein